RPRSRVVLSNIVSLRNGWLNWQAGTRIVQALDVKAPRLLICLREREEGADGTSALEGQTRRGMGSTALPVGLFLAVLFCPCVRNGGSRRLK
ncbi:MAG: hypothetical protein ACPIOQ_57510, partial [Promethearchaeia archaeon]